MTAESVAQKSNPDIRYCIQLASKHTGEIVHLGTKWETREEAQADADRSCCQRCNYIHIVMINDNMRWVDRHHGFVNPDRYEKLQQEKYGLNTKTR